MASINIRNAHHLDPFDEPSAVASEAEDATNEVKEVSGIDEIEDEHGERPSALLKAYRSALLDVTESEWLELDESEALPVDHEKDRRRKRHRIDDGVAAALAPLVPLEPISDLGGPMLAPVEGLKEAACAGADGSGVDQGVEVARAEDRGPADRIAVHRAAPAGAAGRSVDAAKAPEPTHAPANSTESNRRAGSQSVVAATVAEIALESREYETPTTTAQELNDAEDIRARNRAARSPGHGVDSTHRHAADGAASTDNAPAPERREHRPDAAPAAVATPVDPALNSAGTLVNYRFKSWNGQPTVSVRLDTRRGDSSLKVSTDDRRAEAAMRQHADALSLDVPLRFDQDVVDEQGSNGSGQQRESDES